jgi:hypothetical protein
LNVFGVLSTNGAGRKELPHQALAMCCLAECNAPYDLGFFDHETRRLESADNPFAAKVLPMSPAYTVSHVTGIDPCLYGVPKENRTRSPP